MELIKNLQWRYATKRMNGTKVPAEKLDNILTAIQLTPTSLGVQPFKVLVIEDQATLKAIHEKACQQPQVLECSALLVFAARTGLTDAEIDAYMNNVATTRNIPVSALDAFRGMVAAAQGFPSADYTVWAAKQAYIALGVSMVAAAELKIDATPMEGFSGPALDEVLKLEEKGLKSAVLLAVGYRDEQNDYLVNAAKVRKPKEELFEKI
jgi:nitroreductase / dihydropteridine reductase